MTTAHTPGPWVLGSPELITAFGSDYKYNITTPNGPCLAVVLGGEANARLIAAAPELLEALKALHEACDTLLSERSLYKIQGELNMALTAIAKAEGK